MSSNLYWTFVSLSFCIQGLNSNLDSVSTSSLSTNKLRCWVGDKLLLAVPFTLSGYTNCPISILTTWKKMRSRAEESSTKEILTWFVCVSWCVELPFASVAFLTLILICTYFVCKISCLCCVLRSQVFLITFDRSWQNITSCLWRKIIPSQRCLQGMVAITEMKTVTKSI